MHIDYAPLAGIAVIRHTVFGDERGFFMETWNQQTFANLGLDVDFVQDNHSRSRRGTLRGMHFQTEHTQGKLIRVTQGEVFDVAVDVRADSPTCGQWFGITLTATGGEMLWVPPGFAHGFYVLSNSADFLYKCTDFYHPQSEISLAWNDPTVAIEWPLLDGAPPELSAKDSSARQWSDIPLLRA